MATTTWEQQRAEEQRIQVERHKELLAVAQIAAAHLNNFSTENHWTARDEKLDPEYPNQVPDRVYLVNTLDGRRLTLHTTTYNFKGMIEVRGNYDFGPKEYGIEIPYSMKPAPSINVKLERGGVALAKAIMTRFMHDYNEIVGALALRVKESREYREQQVNICERLAGILAHPYSPENSRNGYTGFTVYAKGDSVRSLRAEVYVSNAAVDLKLENLPESLAAEVLKIVAPHLKGGA